MDYAASHIVYVDSRMSRALDGKHIQKINPPDSATGSQETSWEDKHPECLKAILGEIEEVRTSLKNILSVFNGGERLLCFCALKSFKSDFKIKANASQSTRATLELHAWTK